MEYKCNICNKLYSSYQSLWIHNKKYHNKIEKNNNFEQLNNNFTTTKNHICKFCNKQYKIQQSKWKHEQTCKNKKNITVLEDENNKLKNEIIQLKSIIPTNINNGSINNGTINNITNNFVINKIGEEALNKISYDDIKDIFRQQKNCLYHAIKYVNFNEKIPENHNFYNNSLEGKYVNVYNTEKNEVEKQNKKDFYDTVLMSSLNITNLLFDKIKDNVSKVKQKKLKLMIKEIEDIANIDNYKKTYITNFNQISYNNKKIIKNTWDKKLNNVHITEEESDNESINSDSSKDSFYYATDSD
jgi:hypothetical protein